MLGDRGRKFAGDVEEKLAYKGRIFVEKVYEERWGHK